MMRLTNGTLLKTCISIIFYKDCNLVILTNTLRTLLLNKEVDCSLMAKLLELPARTTFENLFKTVDQFSYSRENLI